VPQQVLIQKLEPDWDFLAETTDVRRLQILQKHQPGSWYLNPRYTVHAHQPSPEFLRKARKCQADWFRMMDDSLGSTNRRRAQKRTRNQQERRLAYSGILIVDGKELDPHAWYALEASLGTHPDSEVVTCHRPVHLAEPLSDQLETLKQLSRHDLERFLTLAPGDPLYVTPGVTVTSTVFNKGFHAQLLKHSGQWHRKLDRALGRPRWRPISRQSDLATRMLVFHGVLVINGLFYRPGCWPNHANKHHPARPDARTSTVPAEALGINFPHPERICSPPQERPT
jgi:hypothetical protein